MALTITTNITAMTAQRNLKANTKAVSQSLERLSTGYRINHASDDIAGLSISEGLRTQIRGNDMAIRNVQDGSSLLQIAEGGYVTITENLQRVRELTVQAANGTYTSTERAAIAQEVSQRLEDITRIAQASKFNDTMLLDGSTTSAVLQVGAGTGADSQFDIASALQTLTCGALSVTAGSATVAAGGYFESGGTCRAFLDDIDTALERVLDRRSLVGAYQARLDSILNNLEITNENIAASESRIRDLDIASETAKMTRNQVMQQASVSVMAQANQLPALALSLLG